MDPVAPPPTCTVSHANGESCIVCKESKDLESQITEAETLSASLNSEGLSSKSTMNALNDPIIGRLPLEIASYIFKLYFGMQVKSINAAAVFPRNLMTNAPFRLGAVCRTWRAMAWSSPTLWTSLSLRLRPTWNDDKLELAKQWLGRTGTFPLSIRLYVYDDLTMNGEDVDDLEEQYAEVIDVVNSLSSRWQNIDLELPCFMLHKFRNADPPPSILRHMSLISTTDWPGFPMNEFLYNNPGHSPTHIYLSNGHLDLDNGMGGLDWTHITYFEVDEISVPDSLKVIKTAPLLQEFIVHELEGQFDSPCSIMHPRLRSLEIVRGAVDLKEFLDCLTLPSLENLSLITRYETDILNNLISLIDRSSCHLNVLFLYSFQAFNHEFRMQLLQVTPSLNTLTLNFAGDLEERCLFLEGLLKRKLANSESSTFLPNLKTFKTAFHSSSGSPFETLLEVFKSSQTGQNSASGRGRPHIGPIRSLRFHFSMTGDMPYIDKDVLQGFTELIAGGFNISITRRDEDFIAKSLAFRFPTDYCREPVAANS